MDKFKLRGEFINVEKNIQKLEELDTVKEWIDFKHFVYIDNRPEYIGSISYNYFRKELIFENYGFLPIEALVLGGTEKPDNPELIGRFGEGMKVCALTLLRAGKYINITDQSREIRFFFRQEPLINNLECLHYSSNYEKVSPKNKVKVIIGNIELEEWKQSYKLKFLDLTDINLKIIKPKDKSFG